MLCREGTVEVNCNKTNLFAFSAEVVNCFLCSHAAGTHSDNHAVCFGISVIVEEVVFPAGDFRNLAHVVFNDFGHCAIVVVASLTVLEEYVAVFSHAACNRCVGVEGSFTELCNCFTVEQRCEVFLFKHLDFLDFVRCAETVKEVNERHAALDCCEVCNSGEVHNLLHAALCKHCASGLAGSHNVLMVTKDAECM